MRHDVDLVSLMAGVAFAGVGLVSLLSDGAGLTARWTCPILLILVGIVGLLASRRGTEQSAGPRRTPTP